LAKKLDIFFSQQHLRMILARQPCHLVIPLIQNRVARLLERGEMLVRDGWRPTPMTLECHYLAV
jgi:hypothetical protein